MTAIITWIEAIVRAIPLPLLEVWGRFSFVVGVILALCAFGGFTFRIGEGWGFGRERQRWDDKALLCIPLTFVLIIASGYAGSFIVLVPGAQTFESLKDLVVALTVVLFGYPALITVPFAYGLSDLIEGVPPQFLVDWLPGYFINPACFWLAYQLIGVRPDFRLRATWGRYVAFVVIFMAIEPVLWGYVCSGMFTPEISYRSITPALFFTTTITWLMTPLAMLAALPLARHLRLFWAEIPDHVSARALGSPEWTWHAGAGDRIATRLASQGVPIRMFLLAPFVVLVLVMVGATAYVALRSAESDATRLATQLHQEVSANIRLRLDDYLSRSPLPQSGAPAQGITTMLTSLSMAASGRAFIIDRSGATIASSADDGDAVVADAVAALRQTTGGLGAFTATRQFRFDHVTSTPLSRETWLTYATTYEHEGARRADWILVTAMPEAFYLAGLRIGNSRSAMVFTVALLLSLAAAAVLASMVTEPLRRLSRATGALARGELEERVPGSQLEELGALAQSFNDMAARLKGTFDDLKGEVEMRTRREGELRQSEGRVRESEGRLQLAIEAAGLGIWDWDVVNDRLVWDEPMHRLYGVGRQDFSGTSDAWTQSVVPEDRARAKADVEAALRGERKFATDFRVRGSDGSIRVIRGVAQTVLDTDGRPVRMVGFNWDVTDLQNAEHERERLVHDLGERVKELRLLHAAARLLQPERQFDRGLLEELVALLPGAWQFPDVCEARIAYLDIETSTPGWARSPWTQSAPFTTSDGTGVIEVMYSEERPPATEGPFLVEERALLDSIAELLVAYLELRKYQESMEALVSTRTTELRSAKEAAESANRAKSVFLANMSHEIRTPMNAILGYAQLLQRDPSIGGEQKTKIDIIQASGNHLLTLINDILEMSKIEAGRMTLTVESFDLRALLRDVHLMFTQLTAAKGLDLKFELSGQLPPALTGDTVKVRQVVINLLSNAVKFTERGGVVVRASSGPIAEDRHLVTIVVEDTGPGIDAAKLTRIFDAFDQADSHARSGGTGLGLAISRNFARLMQGELTVESTVGAGSRFTFSFETDAVSIADVAAADLRPLPVGIESPHLRRKVLVVDDVAANRDLLHDLLSRVGLETRAASSGEEAIVVHDAWRPDLILMDLRMPGMDGLEATRRLRADGSTATIMALTASGLAETEGEALEAGVDAFMRKPYRERDLLARIGTLLGLRYIYPPDPAHAASLISEPVALSRLLSAVPAPLAERLREAAIAGRAARLEDLAEDVGEHSQAAAAEIRAIARDFRYDALLMALDGDRP